MNTPRRRGGRLGTCQAAASACLVALVAVTASADPAFEPKTLLARVAQPPPATIRYTEVRFSGLLTQALVVSGQLSYLGPGRFDREVQTPYRERSSIRDGEVVVERDGQPAAHFSLRRAPALEGMLATFGALLSGDTTQLDRRFDVTLSGDDRAWRLQLAPRSSSASKWLSAITIDGSGATPRCLTLVEPDGDRGVMLLGPLADEPLPVPTDPESLSTRCAAHPRD
ncbi:MAG: LolA-related protein [Steroidobacteraceae bacterium]